MAEAKYLGLSAVGWHVMIDNWWDFVSLRAARESMDVAHG